MDRSPITQAEIKDLEQIVFDLRAMSKILADHSVKVESIIKKYTTPKTEAAIAKAMKRQEDKLWFEVEMARIRERKEAHRMKGRIKYLTANPEPGSTQEIKELETILRAKGKLK